SQGHDDGDAEQDGRPAARGDHVKDPLTPCRCQCASPGGACRAGLPRNVPFLTRRVAQKTATARRPPLNPPVAPAKTASPKPKIPPSEATSQYPCPLGVGAMPTMGWFRWMPPVEPWNTASPKLKIPPSEATSQYPRPVRLAVMATIGFTSLTAPVEP